MKSRMDPGRMSEFPVRIKDLSGKKLKDEEAATLNEEWCSHSCKQMMKMMRMKPHWEWKEIRSHQTFLLYFTILLFCLLFSSTEGCSCIYSHPQEHYCSADFVALVNVKRPGKGDHRVISYRVKVKKEFKMTVKARDALKQGLIWTSGEESTCGRNFQPNTRYLITGRIVGEKPWVSVCNYVEKWTSLTYKQKKGFRRLYAYGCHCKVREPPSSAYYSYKHSSKAAKRSSSNSNTGTGTLYSHRLAARPGYCHWETKWEDQLDCQGLHSMCMPVGSSPAAIQAIGSKKKSLKSASKKLKDSDGKSKRVNDLKKYSESLHECQWVQSTAYNDCMRMKREKEEEKWEEP